MFPRIRLHVPSSSHIRPHNSQVQQPVLPDPLQLPPRGVPSLPDCILRLLQRRDAGGCGVGEWLGRGEEFLVDLLGGGGGWVGEGFRVRRGWERGFLGGGGALGFAERRGELSTPPLWRMSMRRWRP
jgi:hypothetical protein